MKYRNQRMINLDQIRKNMEAIRTSLPENVAALAVVKADGYGHGACQTAAAAIRGGASMLAVAAVEEGVQLRQNGIQAPVLVLGPINRFDVRNGIAYDLIQTVCSAEMVAMAEFEAASLQKTAKVHLKVDTGMGRIGVRTKTELRSVLSKLAQSSHVKLTGAYTHFSDADGSGEECIRYTREQFQHFCSMTEELPSDIVRHCCNSAGIHRFPEMYLDMVRVGISLYGYPPVEDHWGLKPCMVWKAAVSFVKKVSAGTYLSYGRTYCADHPITVATVTCGYGDGYHRIAGPLAYVLIRGKRAKILGRICMDQMLADVTEIPGVQPGDEVTLMGRDGDEEITAEDLASWSGTISYEVLLSAAGRVDREFIHD